MNESTASATPTYSKIGHNNDNRCGHQLLDPRSLQYYLQTAIRLNNVSLQQLCCTTNDDTSNVNTQSMKSIRSAIDAIKTIASSDEANYPTFSQLYEMEQQLSVAKKALFNSDNNGNSYPTPEENENTMFEISYTSNSSINNMKSFFANHEANHNSNRNINHHIHRNIDNEINQHRYLSISENDITDSIQDLEDEVARNDQLDFVSTIMLYNLGTMYVARAESEVSFESSSTNLSSVEALLDGSQRLLTLALEVLDEQIAFKFNDDMEYESNNNNIAEYNDECTLLISLFVRCHILSKLRYVASKLCFHCLCAEQYQEQQQEQVRELQDRITFYGNNIHATVVEANEVLQDPNFILLYCCSHCSIEHCDDDDNNHRNKPTISECAAAA